MKQISAMWKKTGFARFATPLAHMALIVLALMATSASAQAQCTPPASPGPVDEHMNSSVDYKAYRGAMVDYLLGEGDYWRCMLNVDPATANQRLATFEADTRAVLASIDKQALARGYIQQVAPDPNTAPLVPQSRPTIGAAENPNQASRQAHAEPQPPPKAQQAGRTSAVKLPSAANQNKNYGKSGKYWVQVNFNFGPREASCTGTGPKSGGPMDTWSTYFVSPSDPSESGTDSFKGVVANHSRYNRDASDWFRGLNPDTAQAACEKAREFGMLPGPERVSRRFYFDSSDVAFGTSSQPSPAASQVMAQNQTQAAEMALRLHNALIPSADQTQAGRNKLGNADMYVAGRNSLTPGAQYGAGASDCVQAVPIQGQSDVYVYHKIVNNCGYEVVGDYCYTNTPPGDDSFRCGSGNGGFGMGVGEVKSVSAGGNLNPGATIYFGACSSKAYIGNFTFVGSRVTFTCKVINPNAPYP